MFFQKKFTPEEGSALLVTIMITSVILIFSIILLERIIPYSKQVRGMQDSVQAYYTARGQVELAKNDFLKMPLRDNIDSNPQRLLLGAGSIIEIAAPNLEGNKFGDYIVISNNNELPLQIRLFEKDTSARAFGTSQANPIFHSLTNYWWGILFDLSKKETSYPPFSMIAHTNTQNSITNANLRIEFVYSDWSGSTPFFGSVGDILVPSVLERKNIANAKDKNREAGRDTLTYILNLQNCKFGSCALKLQLTDTPLSSLPVAFSVSTPIPDLNAVVIADGISERSTYHARIIDLIPLVQSI